MPRRFSQLLCGLAAGLLLGSATGRAADAVPGTFAADATDAAVRALASSGGQFMFQFQERTSLGNVARQFQSSPDLLAWTNTSPAQMNILQTNASTRIYQAWFPAPNQSQFFRILYGVTN